MINSTLEQTLNDVGFICVETKGTSMQPLLVSGKCKVCIEKVNGKINKKDVVLYKRSDGTYILHRVKKVYKNTFTMWGDNHTGLEYGVNISQILGVAVGFYKGDKYVDFKKSFKYKLYKFFWCNFVFVRKVVFKLKKVFKKDK